MVWARSQSLKNSLDLPFSRLNSAFLLLFEVSCYLDLIQINSKIGHTYFVHRINAKFTDESYAIIEKYLDEHKMKKNQLIKNSIGMYIALTSSSKALLESDSATRDFFKGIKQIVNSKEYKHQVNQLLEKLSKKYSNEELKLLCSAFTEIEHTLKIIQKKNKAGRKKNIKKGPGHPPTYE